MLTGRPWHRCTVRFILNFTGNVKMYTSLEFLMSQIKRTIENCKEQLLGEYISYEKRPYAINNLKSWVRLMSNLYKQIYYRQTIQHRYNDDLYFRLT